MENAPGGPEAIHGKAQGLLSESGLDWTLQQLLTISGCPLHRGLLPRFNDSFSVADRYCVPALLVWGLATCLLLSCAKKRGKRMEEMEAQLPDALDFLARSMRAGHAFTISLEMVGEEIAAPLGPGISRILQ